MSSRPGKRRRRGNPPMPMWLPLPRPCLRSLNVPHPYCMPIPEMYLPPWALPSPYLTNPVCHCANENFCTAASCRDSSACQRMRPFYCPRGVKGVDNADLQSRIEDGRENGQDSSPSAADICSSCGAHTNGKIRPEYVSKSNLESSSFNRQYSEEQVVGQSTNNIETSERNLFVRRVNPNMTSGQGQLSAIPDELDDGSNGSNAPVVSSAQQSTRRCNNASCQTQLELIGVPMNTLPPRRNNSSFITQKSYSQNRFDESSAMSFGPITGQYLPVPPDRYDNFSKTSFTSRRPSQTTNSTAYRPSSSSRRGKRRSGNSYPSHETPSDSEQQPNDCKGKTIPKSKCCITTSDSVNGCQKPAAAVDKIQQKPRRKMSPKLSSTKFRKLSHCECSPKLSDGEIPRKHSNCECISTSTSPRNSSRKKDKDKKTKTSSDDELKSKDNEVTSPQVTNQQESKCPCRFPPAYKNLSCTGNTNGKCSCADNSNM